MNCTKNQIIPDRRKKNINGLECLLWNVLNGSLYFNKIT